MPKVKQQLKHAKPVKQTIQMWHKDSFEKLQGCLYCTDWDVFKAGNSLSQKWFCNSIRPKLHAKGIAYKNKDSDPITYSRAKKELEQSVKAAKLAFKDKLESNLDTDDTRGVWSGVQTITNYKRSFKSISDNDPCLPDKLNDYYARFDKSNAPGNTIVSSSAPSVPPFVVSEAEVRRILQRLDMGKAAGPDRITPRLFRTCAPQLAGVFMDIFNWSLRSSEVPLCFEKATIVPVPKKNSVKCLNDYRPVALTSVVMKVFERLLLVFLKSVLPSSDPFQFAYRANRCVEDAISICLHRV